METTQKITEGSRQTLAQSVERFPHFVAPAGATGEVVEATEDLVRLRLDAPLTGAEEWDNEVCWSGDDDPTTGSALVAADADLTPRYTADMDTMLPQDPA